MRDSTPRRDVSNQSREPPVPQLNRRRAGQPGVYPYGQPPVGGHDAPLPLGSAARLLHAQQTAKTRAQANSRACKWPCMCKTEEQKRPGARGGDRAECLPACPKFAWMRDPGWPHTPTIADSPAIGARFSYLPSSGKVGMIEYCGRNEWDTVDGAVAP